MSRKVQSCGHSTQFITSDIDGIAYCLACEDAAAIKADLRNQIACLIDELAKARADNAILESAIMGAETIQPNGEIGTSVADLVRELERAREGERIAMAQLSNAQRRITELNTEIAQARG